MSQWEWDENGIESLKKHRIRISIQASHGVLKHHGSNQLFAGLVVPAKPDLGFFFESRIGHHPCFQALLWRGDQNILEQIKHNTSLWFLVIGSLGHWVIGRSLALGEAVEKPNLKVLFCHRGYGDGVVLAFWLDSSLFSERWGCWQKLTDFFITSIHVQMCLVTDKTRGFWQICFLFLWFLVWSFLNWFFRRASHTNTSTTTVVKCPIPSPHLIHGVDVISQICLSQHIAQELQTFCTFTIFSGLFTSINPSYFDVNKKGVPWVLTDTPKSNVSQRITNFFMALIPCRVVEFYDIPPRTNHAATSMMIPWIFPWHIPP